MRVVFMGTPEFSVPTLERLIASEHQVVSVYTQPDSPAGRGRELRPSPVKRLALAYGLTVIQPTSLRWPAEVERLGALKPDVIVVAAYGLILPQAVLDIPPFGCLNVHPSLLPRHRGPSPINGAILAGDEETGVTIMLLDAGMDSGPILAQSRVPIEPQDTTASLGARLAALGAQFLAETLEAWVECRMSPLPQDESKATYTKQLSKGDGELNWQLPALTLWRRVRAFQPWPGCYTRWQGKLLKVIEVVPLTEGPAGGVGEVVALGLSGAADVGVVTGDGILGLRRIQLEGKRAMSAEEFVRGQREFIGAILPS